MYLFVSVEFHIDMISIYLYYFSCSKTPKRYPHVFICFPRFLKCILSAEYLTLVANSCPFLTLENGSLQNCDNVRGGGVERRMGIGLHFDQPSKTIDSSAVFCFSNFPTLPPPPPQATVDSVCDVICDLGYEPNVLKTNCSQGPWAVVPACTRGLPGAVSILLIHVKLSIFSQFFFEPK